MPNKHTPIVIPLFIAEIFDRATAEDVQLRFEYAPAPPFGMLHPDHAPANVTARLRSDMNAGLMADRASAQQAAASTATRLQATPVLGITAVSSISRDSRHYSIIQAPSILGLRTTGVERLPERLLEHGLAQSLNARVATRLEALPQQPGRDPETQTLNASAIAAWSAVERADKMKGDKP
jgi:hypothetical protein